MESHEIKIGLTLEPCMQKNHSTSESNSWSLCPEGPELAEDEVHVWRADLECDARVLRRLEATLSTDERARANRFLFQPDRNHFIATRGILRELLGRYVNRAPEHLEFDYAPQGKPTLHTELPHTSVRFNVSHSHGMALLAFTVGRQVGVDLELVRKFGGQEIAARFFSPQEVMELSCLPQWVQDEGFFLCWTRKEAYVKARGEGLNIPLKSFHVTLTPGKPECLHAADDSNWTLRSLRPDPQYVGALVAEGRGWKLRQWNWKSPDGP